MNYRNLSIQENSAGDFSLVPIRMEDREAIRAWRNEQMYHLRVYLLAALLIQKKISLPNIYLN